MRRLVCIAISAKRRTHIALIQREQKTLIAEPRGVLRGLAGPAKVRAVRSPAAALCHSNQHFPGAECGATVRAVRGPGLDPSARGLMQLQVRIRVPDRHVRIVVAHTFEGNGAPKGHVLRFDFDGAVGTAEPQAQTRGPERQEHGLTFG